MIAEPRSAVSGELASPRAVIRDRFTRRPSLYNPSMDDAARERMGQRLRLAFQLHEDGVSLMRQNIRRRYPGETEIEIDRRLLTWLHHRPGAEHGDALGRPVELPRRIG
jgi:hypothetical protein